jgi:hypothetical protein
MKRLAVILGLVLIANVCIAQNNNLESKIVTFNVESPPPYKGSPEKIEISVNDIQKIDSLPDLRPSYNLNYKIIRFEVWVNNSVGTKQNFCFGSAFSPVVSQVFKNTKSHAKFLIDGIVAKDLKTNKVISLQPLSIKVK